MNRLNTEHRTGNSDTFDSVLKILPPFQRKVPTVPILKERMRSIRRLKLDGVTGAKL